MIQDLEAIEYRHGILKKNIQIADLPLLSLKGASIPSKIRKELLETDILNCGGCYGDRSAGDPVQYDHLKIILTDDTVEIVFFNRAIALFTTDDEKIRKIHRFLSVLEETK